MEDVQKQLLTKDEIKTAEKLVEELFKKLDVHAEMTIDGNEDSVDVRLQTEESGMIIGYHGETLESLQVLLSLALSKKVGRFVRVMIDVGDYRKNRTEYLENLAAQIKERALRENREQVVTALKSWERRVIHMLLKEDPDVLSESQGTGRERVLVIRPK